MFAMFLADLYVVEVLETEASRQDLMQYWSETSESVTAYIYGCCQKVEQFFI